MSLSDRLPADGAMGALHRKRPSLYYLVVLTGGTAFVGVLLGLLYAVLLFPLIAAQAVTSAATGEPTTTGLWFVLMVAVAVFFTAVVVAVGRWVGQFGTAGGEE